MWQKTIHIGLMLLVFFSSTSMMISKHYCSDELMGTSFMTEAESCHDTELTEVPCPNHPVNQQDKKDCCTNEFHLVKTELNHDLHQPQLKTFQFSEIVPVLIFLLSIKDDLDSDSKICIPAEWDPPSPNAVELPRIQRFLC